MSGRSTPIRRQLIRMVLVTSSAVLLVTSCSFFAYELTDFQKAFKRLVDHARAEWTFTAVEGGTLVHWTYEFVPNKRWGWLVGLILRLWWEPYMRSVLPEIVHEAERLA